MKILIVNRFFGGAQIPTGRMAEDVARLLVEEGHEVSALASSGEYAGAVAQARGQETKRPKDQKTAGQRSEIGSQKSQTGNGTLRVETVWVPKWMPRALAWVWFTWQARKRIPRVDWDVCILMTDPPLLPLLARRAAGMRHTADGIRENSHEDAQKDLAGQPRDRTTTSPSRATRDSARRSRGQTPPNHATRRVAVWLMDLYPEALAASGRIGPNNPLYKWYFHKRQKALGLVDLLICLGHAQKELLGDGRVERGACPPARRAYGSERSVEPEADGRRGEGEAFERQQGTGGRGQAAVGTEQLSRAKRDGVSPADAGRGQKPNYRTTEPPRPPLTQRVRTAVVPPWDDRGNIALATEDSLRNLVLYAGNLGEAHCFEEIIAAAPYLPADWTIRFAARGAKLSALLSKLRSDEWRVTGDESGSAPAFAAANDSCVTSGSLKLTDLKIKTAGAVVHVSGYESEEETPGLLASARVHLITMSPGWEGIVVPSKLYGCIRTGRPVLFIGPENADTAGEIRAHNWGKVLPPGASGKDVAAAILELAARPTRAPQSENGAKKVAELIQGLATAEQREP